MKSVTVACVRTAHQHNGVYNRSVRTQTGAVEGKRHFQNKNPMYNDFHANRHCDDQGEEAISYSKDGIASPLGISASSMTNGSQ